VSDPARKIEFRPRRSGPARAFDSVAKYVITAGGILIIVSVIGILAFILLETLPLFLGAETTLYSLLGAPREGEILAAGTDQYRDLLFEVMPGGTVVFRSLPAGEAVEEIPVPGAEEALTAARVTTRGGHVAWGDEGGRAGLFQAWFRTEYLPGGGRDTEPSLRERAVLDLETGGLPIGQVAGGRDEDGIVTLAAVLEGGGARVGVFDPEEEESWTHDLAGTLASAATSLALTDDGSLLAVGTREGETVLWEIAAGAEPRFLERTGVTPSSEVPVRSLAFLLGGQSLVVGGEDGSLSVWSRVPRPEGWRLREIHTFPPHASAVTALAASPRDKGFLSASDDGEVRLQYATSERTLARLSFDGAPRRVRITPRADGALVLGLEGNRSLWEVRNPHPEVSWKTLLGKVWYEGHAESAYVWQSSAAEDEFEPKMSLIPLLFGTVKGALYALIFSVPIAVLGAVYTAQFAHPRVKNAVKPFVETLAALPSVIIGFLAGLWLAPLLAGIFPEVLLMLVFVPVLVAGGSLGWEALPRQVRGRFPLGTELYLILAVASVGVGLALLLGSGFEEIAFGGDFSQWVVEVLHLRFDPRNSVLVGFALGFAVIPIIFTIAEDALSSVPRSLVTASLALGASRWATAWRVVVPTASAGIFSAVMLGFGRAVGETMIVLMATGNTPIMDWSPFVGMRTLSANIAVEIPEAPHGGTLYRVLFLSAALLFVLTFVINTLAEVVSHRLRRKYQRL